MLELQPSVMSPSCLGSGESCRGRTGMWRRLGSCRHQQSALWDHCSCKSKLKKSKYRDWRCFWVIRMVNCCGTAVFYRVEEDFCSGHEADDVRLEDIVGILLHYKWQLYVGCSYMVVWLESNKSFILSCFKTSAVPTSCCRCTSVTHLQ